LVHFTSPPNENKTQFHVLRWLARFAAAASARRFVRWLAGHVAAAARLFPGWVAWHVAAVGAELFGVQDRIAIQHGWVITRRHCGLARSYRDPRFDWLRACPQCDGRGVTGDRPCPLCDATGRVTQAPRLEGQSP
jgi:hypothetical protein